MRTPSWLRSLARTLGLVRKPSRHARPAKWTAGKWLRVDLLEDRLAPAAVVSTDKPDYTPGTTALFTAFNDASTGHANFDFANEVVQFRVTRTDGQQDFPAGNMPWRVQDNVGGF